MGLQYDILPFINHFWKLCALPEAGCASAVVCYNDEDACSRASKALQSPSNDFVWTQLRELSAHWEDRLIKRRSLQGIVPEPAPPFRPASESFGQGEGLTFMMRTCSKATCCAQPIFASFDLIEQPCTDWHLEMEWYCSLLLVELHPHHEGECTLRFCRT